MKLMFQSLMKYKRLLLLDFISVFGFALAELGIPTIISNMVDNGIDKADPSYLYSQFGLILFVSILGTCGTVLLAYCSVKLSTNVMYDLRKQVFEHAMEFSREEMEQIGVSSMITRTGQDAFQIQTFLNTLLRSALLSPVMLATCIVLILRISLPLSMVILGTIPIIIIGVTCIFKPAGRMSERQQKSIDRINEILQENISGIRVVRAFNQQKYEEARFEKENKYYMTQTSRLFKLMNVSEPMFFFLMNMAVILVYYFASIMLQNHTLLIGQLMAFVEYLFHCMMSVLVFCMVFVMYPRASVSAHRIEQVLAMKPSIRDPENPKEISEISPVQSLEFDHVSFVYPDGKGSVLKDVSFKVHAGQKFAVVGSTGSGKSTLAQLLDRLYDPKSGSIKINDTDIREYKLSGLHDQVGYISQKAHIFTGTIADNIAFGNANLTEEQMLEAAETAQALEFIEKREGGLENTISEEGTNLSGGQKQRLSIARAIARKPGIYVFDDSFSALDFATDAALRKALEPIVSDKILVIVAQRVSTILDADQILVLDKGEAAGLGTHEELMQSCEIYRQIVLSQMSEEEAMGHVR